MSRTLTIKVEELNEDWLNQLKEDHPGAAVELIIHDELTASRMDEATFWKVINQLDWNVGESEEEILKPAVQYLRQFDQSSIYRFYDILSEKLYELDTQVHAEANGGNRYGGPEPFLSDSFLYTRAAVVANGKAFFERVLKEPQEMPGDYTFEALLDLAPKAYEAKTNQPWAYQAPTSFETFSNREGWNGKSWEDQLLSNLK